MARETIVLFFLEIWPIFKARFGGEIIASQISAKDEKWKLSTTRSLRVTFYTQFPKIRVNLLVNFCMQFLHACFARVLLLWFACNTADLIYTEENAFVWCCNSRGLYCKLSFIQTSRLNEFPTPETIRGMGSSFRRKDFWNRLGGLERYLWLVDSIQGDH